MEAEKPKLKMPQVWCLVRDAYSFQDGSFILCPLEDMVEGKREKGGQRCLFFFLNKGLTAFTSEKTSLPSHSLKAPPVNTIALGINGIHWNLERTQIFKP